MLLPFVMCVLILYVPLPAAHTPAPWPLMLAGVAVLAVLNAAAGWLGSGLALRLGSVRTTQAAIEADRIFALLKGGVVGFVLADVFLFRWPVVVERLVGVGPWAALAYDLVLVAPALVMILTAMAWQHRYEHRQGRVTLPLGRYVWLRARVELGILLAPWLILVLAGGVAMVLFGNRPWADLANGLTTGAVLVLLVVLSPLLLQAIWDTSSLPAGPLRERLEAFCRAQRFRCRDILVWHTHRHMANAGVVGPTPLIRYVMLTDALLHHSPDAEVEAVFAHEVAHVRCRHLPFYVAFGLAFIVFLANLLDALAALGWVAPIEGSLGAVMATEHGVAMLAFGAFYWVVVFGYVSRRMELQADVYAVSAVEAPSAFLSALARLRALSRSPGGTSLWRHFSLDQRIALLERLRDDPAATAAFQRSVARLKRVFLLLAAAATLRLLVFRPELIGL